MKKFIFIKEPIWNPYFKRTLWLGFIGISLTLWLKLWQWVEMEYVIN